MSDVDTPDDPANGPMNFRRKNPCPGCGCQTIGCHHLPCNIYDADPRLDF